MYDVFFFLLFAQYLRQHVDKRSPTQYENPRAEDKHF